MVRRAMNDNLDCAKKPLMQQSSLTLDSSLKNKGSKLVVSPAPYADESFIGYLIRLTDLNHYDASTWILQLANLGDRLYKVSIAFNNQLDLTSLANLVGVGEKRLSALLFQPIKPDRPKFGNYSVFEQSVPRLVIKSQSHKVCPRCLTEYGYIRKIWDLVPVTVCPLHKCLLLDQCHNCGGRLRFSRNRVSVCRCEYDWSKAPITNVSDSELELSKRVNWLCNLSDGDDGSAFEDAANPLNRLDLAELFSAVLFIASQYSLSSHLKSKRVLITKFGKSLPNADIHQLLTRAVRVFHNWPANYFSFLDWRKENLQPARNKGGVWKDFGPLESALYRLLTSTSLDFLRDAFEEYITTTWDGGYARKFRRLNEKQAHQKKFVSVDEARELLKLGSEKILSLVQDGNLTAKIRSHGHARVILIETKSIDEFKTSRGDLLDRKQTAKRLGINSIQTRALADANLLTEYDSFDGRSTVFYSINDIDGLVAKLINSVQSLGSKKTAQTINFANALYNLACHHDISVAEFIQAILKGEIKPCGRVKKPGFRSLLFLRQDVINYQEDIYTKRYPNVLNTLEAAEALRTHPKIVRFLVKNNLLHSLRVRWWLAIPQAAVTDFSSKYVLTQALAKELRTSTRHITNILELEGIQPIPFTKVHNKPSYVVYNKSVIDNLNLHDLIESKRQVITFQSQLLSISAAAQFLQTTPEKLSTIIANGVLAPHVTPRRMHPQKDHFTLRKLRRLKGKVNSYAGLVSVQIAAQMFAMSAKSFNARFVFRKRLNVMQVDGDRASYFRKTEVQKLADQLNDLVGASDVRSLLELSESQLLRLINSKGLNPVSGPHTDGSAVNLFLRGEVESLRRQRQAFKRKRVRAGGSARFGKQAGPNRRPVIELIKPRVIGLISRGKRPGKRLSGFAIHDQLLREGYNVGINSVYVCLRIVRRNQGK